MYFVVKVISCFAWSKRQPAAFCSEYTKFMKCKTVLAILFAEHFIRENIVNKQLEANCKIDVF